MVVPGSAAHPSVPGLREVDGTEPVQEFWYYPDREGGYIAFSITATDGARIIEIVMPFFE